jgi:hypothetical protein
LALPNATIISLEKLEKFYPELLSVKSGRSAGEYCWTCKGPSLQYCFDEYELENCTYLDSDLYFFNNPEALFAENTDCDVIITKHGYSPKYDLSETNGHYCAQFMYFRNTENGRKILKWWTSLCIEWCYAKHEPGRFGDQKYLDRFSDEFPNVHDLRTCGAFGPWAVQKYRVFEKNGNLTIEGKIDNRKSLLYFFHFHFLTNQNFGKYNEFLLGPYFLSQSVKRLIYRPYLVELKEVDLLVSKMGYKKDVLGSRVYAPFSTLKIIWHFAKNVWKTNKILWKRRKRLC